MPRISKEVKQASAHNVIAGVAKRLAKHKMIVLGREPFTPDELIAVYRAHLDAIRELSAAHAAVSAATARERRLADRVRYLTRLLKSYVLAVFGSSPTHWGDFGWEVPKVPGPKTVQAKLEGAEKLRGTRKARGTMGKRQRKKIKGY